MWGLWCLGSVWSGWSWVLWVLFRRKGLDDVVVGRKSTLLLFAGVWGLEFGVLEVGRCVADVVCTCPCFAHNGFRIPGIASETLSAFLR